MKRRLPRPRLLQATIAAMAALLMMKTVLLVQAVAEEAAPPAKAEQPQVAAQEVATQAGPPLASLTPPPMPGETPKRAGPVAIQPSSETPAVSEAERSVLLDLRQRREALDNRAKELDQRAGELAAADRRLNDRVQQLTALQTRLEALEAARQQHKEENWAGLVKVYEQMKPRDAAAIFDVLDMQVLLQVLDRMQERRVAPVLAAMQPDRARLATQLLAEMRTRAISPTPSNPKG